ncbi:MAG: methylenetetrahydrofolate reductase C-terminal domain-containing protein [Lacisediminihabitans sp.]
MTSPLLTCPKHMEYGPCGGVEFDGSCEVSPRRCVFLDTATVQFRGTPTDAPPTAAAASMRERLATTQIVVADFPARALSAASIVECAAILAGNTDAVLAGDAGNARVQFPPAYRAHLIQSAGIPVWTGINNRDRNRVAIEGELAALAEVGVAGVHCVTGDHTLTGDRPDAAPVFDLDSTRTATLARAVGHLVSVAEAPATPPIERRPDRLLQKMRAGAEVCFVNHAGGVEPVRVFVDRAHQLGATMAFIPCVPVVVDRQSAELLESFTTLVLPDGFLARILAARDPFEEGIAAAVELSRELLQLDGVRGVNLSGGTSAGREAWFAEALARIGAELHG